MNMSATSRPPVALIAGPTASGKSALALALAEAHRGWVINADSAQVYADLSILSARPQQRDLARAPHRLFGHVAGDQPYSAATWAAEARQAIAECQAAGGWPILVGGTGLYLRTLLDGIAPVPPIDPAVRAEVRALPVAEAYRQLALADAEAALRLAATDTTRVARALEVMRATGRPLAAWQAERRGGIGGSISLQPIVLLPDRAWLFARCDARFEAMMAGGGIAEVEALLANRNIPAAAPVRQAIGVREVAGWLTGQWTFDEAIARGKTATRQYAKRQYTWFRNQPPPIWRRVAETDLEERIRAFRDLFAEQAAPLAPQLPET